jgi:nucleoside-diphosphate-sugar epimerase
MKRILVTGATGRIGRRVVPLLIKRGYRVRVMLRRPPPPGSWVSEAEVIQGSLPGRDTLHTAVADTDAVIHLAGIMPPAADDEVFGTNIEGTYQVLQAVAARQNKPRLLFASSDATYCTGWSLSAYSAPISEDAEQHPTVFYGLSKVIGERMCRYFEEMHNVPIVRLRFVWTLEAAEIFDLFLKAPYRDYLAVGDRGAWDEQGIVAVPLEEDGRPFCEHVCDVRDAAEAVVLALEGDAAPGQAFNIAGPEPFRYTDVGPELAKKIGTRAVAARCQGIHSYAVSIDKARAVLGYRPRFKVLESLADALAKAKA